MKLIIILLLVWILFEFFYQRERVCTTTTSLPFINKNLYIAPSNLPNSGYGVFTRGFIPKGTIIERAHCIPIPVEERGYLTTLLKYDFTCFNDPNKTLIAMGFGGIYNHKDDYNVKWSSCDKTNTVTCTTIRDIQPNEELYIDYGSEYFKLHGMIDTSK